MFGADYQTYFCVAILKHLNLKNDLNDINQKIIQHHTYKDLQIYLKVLFHVMIKISKLE